MKFVVPKVYLVGYTNIDGAGLSDYLRDAGATQFLGAVDDARRQGLSDGEILCSFYAKLCYSSLVEGQNDNLAGVRDVHDNLVGCFGMGHGSVFEHANINFVARNVSRVLTHELVRHRAGAAFSQTSGRYVRRSSFDFVLPPELEPVRADVEALLKHIEHSYGLLCDRLIPEGADRDAKKKLTSALRRVLPNGMANEIGFTLNIRTLRHVVMMRTSRHAEWEIRKAFGDVYRLAKARFPLVFHGAEEEMVDGLLEVSGMRMQPYDRR